MSATQVEGYLPHQGGVGTAEPAGRILPEQRCSRARAASALRWVGLRDSGEHTEEGCLVFQRKEDLRKKEESHSALLQN